MIWNHWTTRQLQTSLDEVDPELYDNIKEITKIIIKKLYGGNNKGNDKENKNKNKIKKRDEIPIRILKQIDLFYKQTVDQLFD